MRTSRTLLLSVLALGPALIGVQTGNAGRHDPLLPKRAYEGDQLRASFGHSVGTAGDVNGDGYDDLIVGARAYDNGEAHEGRGYVYLGSTSGPAAVAAWTAEPNQANASFGTSVGTAGDVNGDGYDDVIVGARWYDNGEADEGRAYVYLGSPSGPASTPVWTAESDQANASFGTSVGAAGDVNGDGYDDVIVGASEYFPGGRAYVYLGSPSGPASTPVWTAESDQLRAFFGISVGTAGDVNGDGYDDVIVGSPSYGDYGRAFVYLGSPSGPGPDAAWSDDDRGYANFGDSVATAGDVNGDGYDDVIVGNPLYSHYADEEGKAYVYLGSPSGLGESPGWHAHGGLHYVEFGSSVATAGDVNADGYDDVIVGAENWDNYFSQFQEGKAYVFLGSPAGLAQVAAWSNEGNQMSAFFGVSVGTAGDADGDGYDDLIVGADRYDHGQYNEGIAVFFPA